MEHDLKTKVLEHIEKDHIKQRSKTYFSVKDKTFWVLGLVSVIIGSIAISVMIFVFNNSESDIYLITHDSFTDFLLSITPYIWIIVFAIFILVGYENFKHTNSGYKYSFGVVVFVSLIFNIVGGLILHTIGISEFIDRNVSFNTTMFKSFNDTRKDIWNRPERGVISGIIVSVDDDSSVFTIKDNNDKTWVIVSDLVPDIDLDLISTSSMVRLIGIRRGESIIACYILPWQIDEYKQRISDIGNYMIIADDYERKLSVERNKECKSIKPYTVIQNMVNY